MAVPTDIYSCESFSKGLKQNPQMMIDIVYLADIEAGVRFCAPRRVCRNLNEESVRSHPLYKSLLHTLVLAWETRMAGLEVRPVPGAGHDLFIARLVTSVLFYYSFRLGQRGGGGPAVQGMPRSV